MHRRRLVLAALMSVWSSALPAAGVPGPADAQNLTPVASFPLPQDDRGYIDRGGTDLAFDGRYVYAADQGREGESGGVRIIDTAGRRPRSVAYFRCGGWQNDVAVVRPGLLAIGYHAGRENCGSKSGGVTLVDVRVPARPRLLGSTPEGVGASDVPDGLSGVHTITPYPGTPYVYASPGGRHTLTGSIETIVDVRDPMRPKVAARFETTIGCHDLTFDIREGRRLAFCSGIGETQVWDVADPLAPRVIGAIVNPLHPFQHSSAVSGDGSLLVVGTETIANDCAGGPTGALLAYDITRPEVPVLLGGYGAQRGAGPAYSFLTDPGFDALCAPHQFNFVPGTRTVVSGNGSGGVSVIDFEDPRAPREVGYHLSPDRDYFAAYWLGGRIYANGVQALDVFDLRSSARTVSRPARPPAATRALEFTPRSSDGATVCFVPEPR